MSDQNPDAAIAGANATVPDALALNTLAVIGLFNTSNGATALLRSSRGEIARVSVGEEAFGVQVTAIGDDQILLINRWGRTEALQLPRS